MIESRVDKYTPESVRLFFQNFNEYKAYVDKGDPSHIEVYVDIMRALMSCDVTDEEMLFFIEYYVEQKTTTQIHDEYLKYSRSGIDKKIRKVLATVTSDLTGQTYNAKDVKLR